MSVTRNTSLDKVATEELAALEIKTKRVKEQAVNERTSSKQLSAYGLLSPSCDTVHSSVKVQKILTCTLNSNLEAAKKMLINNSALFSVEGSIGEHQHVTAFQLAWEIRDAGMCNMMLDNGNVQINAKLLAQPEPKIPLDALEKVIAAIADSDEKTIVAELERPRNPGYQISTLGQSMDEFRAICDKHGETTPQDVSTAFALYVEHWMRFKTGDQCALFFRQVIGYVERLEPVWFKQALVQGINNFLKDPFGDNLGMWPVVVLQRVNNDAHPVISHEPQSGLGYDFACDGFGPGNYDSILSAIGMRGEWPGVGIETFCRATEAIFDELRERIQSNVAERPSI